MVSVGTTNITTYIPELSLKNTELYRGEGCMVTWLRPQTAFYCILCAGEIDTIDDDKGNKTVIPQWAYCETRKLMCSLTKVSRRKKNVLGYLVRLTKPTPDTMTPPGWPAWVLRNPPRCQFFLDPATGNFVRSIQTTQNTELTGYDASPLGSNDRRAEDFNEAAMREMEERGLLPVNPRKPIEDMLNKFAATRRNYAENVVTRRVQSGRLKHIVPEPTRLQVTIYGDSDDPKTKGKRKDDESSIEKARIVKLKKAFQSSLSRQPIPGEIINLLLVSGALLLSLFFFVILEYVHTELAFNSLDGTFGISWMCSDMYRYLGDSAYLGLSLALLSTGALTNYENETTKTGYEAMVRAQLGYNVKRIEEIVKEIASAAQEFEDIEADVVYRKDVALVTYGTYSNAARTDNNTLIESFLSINSALLSLKKTALTDIGLNNRDLLYVRDNYFNGISEKVPRSSSQIDSTLRYYTESKLSADLYIFVSATTIVVICVVLVVPFIFRAKKSKQEVLTNFLRIPKRAIGDLCSKCERYVGDLEKDLRPDYVQTMREDTEGSEEKKELLGGEQLDHIEESHTGLRHFRGVTSDKCSTILKCLFVMLTLDGYFFFCYYYAYSQGEIIQRLYKSLHAIGSLQQNTLESFNVLREAIFSSNLTVLYKSDKVAVAERLIMEERYAMEDILWTCLLSNDSHVEFDKDYANGWLHNSICSSWERFEFFNSTETCQSFLGGITITGTYSLLSDYLFVYRKLLTDMANTTTSSSNILNTDEWANERELVHYIFSVVFEEYNNYNQMRVTDEVEETTQLKVIVMLSFLFAMLFFFLTFWIPYLVRLRTELWRTDGMLILIPNDVIAHNKLLRDQFMKKNPLFTQETTTPE